MKFPHRQAILAAIFILPLGAMLAWQGLRSDTEADAPKDLVLDVQVTQTTPQRTPSPASPLRSPAPLKEADSPNALPENDVNGKEPRHDEAADNGFCVLITGTSESEETQDPAQVQITRLTPENPTWSVEAPLINGTAQFGELPEGTFRVVVFSSSQKQIAQTHVEWPSSNGKQTNRLEFNLNKLAAESRENAAIATLRMIAGAQQQVQASSAIDTDGDGGGQYAFFGELAGSVPMRVYGPNGGLAGGPTDKMNPPFLATAMGEIQAASNYGCILRKGYYFRIHLPALSSPDAEAVAGVYESPLGGIGANAVDPSFGELFWGAYAWPAEAGAWPQSTFFISQEGDVAKLGAAGSTRYFGLNGGPTFDAAYSSETPGDMRGATAFAAMGRAANDGGVWTQAGN